LLDLVGGNSEEEIEASIALMRQKTDAILTSVAEAQRGQRQAQPTARATQPPVGPMETDQLQESYSPAEIAAMDMHTYQKLRPQLLAASSQQYRQGTPS
jgi:hypothetical protein